MNNQRFFFSFNEDCWFGKKITRFGLIIVIISFILINSIPLKSIANKYYQLYPIMIIVTILFGVKFFYNIFFDITPNILKYFPKLILLIISFILILVGIILARDNYEIVAFLILMFSNYMIGYDKKFNRNNLFENMIVSLIRFINFLVNVMVILILLMKIGIIE
jgi:hypothetical protein